MQAHVHGRGITKTFQGSRYQLPAHVYTTWTILKLRNLQIGEHSRFFQ